MKQKIVACVLLFALLLSLAGCGKSYPAVSSTETEAKTVLRMGEYEVPYEVVRAFLLPELDAMDGGDRITWLNDRREETVSAAMEKVLPQIAEIYALFTYAEALGVDLYDRTMEDAIAEYVRISVEGGIVQGETVLGHESYEDYLAALESMYLNDSMGRLMMRYSLAESRVFEAFLEQLEYTEADVEAFYDSDACVRVNWLYRPYYYSEYFTPEADRALAEEAQKKLAAARTEEDRIRVLVQYSSGLDTASVEEGHYLGRYTLDSADMAELISHAFSLKAGEVSPVIENYYGVYVVYGMEKPSDFLELDENYERIAEIYLYNSFYEKLEECKQKLLKTVSYTDFYATMPLPSNQSSVQERN